VEGEKMIQIHAIHDALVPLKELEPHPKNRNKHSKEQIERLAKMYEYHGVRSPIIVSKESGFIVAGHGRLEAAIKAGMTDFPVVYQSFKDSDAEYAFLTADNAISEWSEIDLSGVNSDVQDLGPDFDIDMLGIKNFEIDFAFGEIDKDEEKEEMQDKKEKKCPACGEVLNG
jgi:hypothetical protein